MRQLSDHPAHTGMALDEHAVVSGVPAQLPGDAVQQQMVVRPGARAVEIESVQDAQHTRGLHAAHLRFTPVHCCRDVHAPGLGVILHRVREGPARHVREGLVSAPSHHPGKPRAHHNPEPAAAPRAVQQLQNGGRVPGGAPRLRRLPTFGAVLRRIQPGEQRLGQASTLPAALSHPHHLGPAARGVHARPVVPHNDLAAALVHAHRAR
mmetsp:Transcript_66784/g.173736  ORF Transcript_66784/g.173736 Transcript_66784/m.173736 type:complete len:208 (+) Transcript_66784:288-911(+)